MTHEATLRLAGLADIRVGKPKRAAWGWSVVLTRDHQPFAVVWAGDRERAIAQAWALAWDPAREA